MLVMKLVNSKRQPLPLCLSWSVLPQKSLTAFLGMIELNRLVTMQGWENEGGDFKEDDLDISSYSRL